MSDASQPAGEAKKPFVPVGRELRANLNKSFLQALHDDFQVHGVKTIEQARRQKPMDYLKLIAGFATKELSGEDGKDLFAGLQVTFVVPDKK